MFKLVCFTKPTREFGEFLDVCQVCVTVSGSPNLPLCIDCYVKT